MGRGKQIDPRDAQEIYRVYCESGSKCAKALSAAKGYHTTSYYKIINHEGNVTPKPHIQPEKWSPEQIENVISWIENGHIQSTLIEIRDYWIQQGYPEISIGTMWRYLDDRLITVKQATEQNQMRNDLKTRVMRAEYSEWFLENQNLTFVFIDEFGFNLNTTRRLARAPRGKRAIVTCAQNKGTNVSVMAAIEKTTGLVLEMHHSGSMNADDWMIFLTTLNIAIQEKGLKNVCLIYDNCRIHSEEVVQQMCNYANWIYSNLPPYSPMLNPIEEVINDIKYEIKKELSTTYLNDRLKVANMPFRMKEQARMQILDNALKAALQVVTPDKVLAHYNHTLQFIPMCIEGKEV